MCRLAGHCAFPLLWSSDGLGARLPLRVKGIFLPTPNLLLLPCMELWQKFTRVRLSGLEKSSILFSVLHFF